jgi:folate-dependent phosphoribosylglycinamide formyltransferase PurN
VFLSRCVGTNLQALIDHAKTHAKQVSFEIALVVSNVANVGGLKRAEVAGIPTQV